ncbi:hypothetical protein SAMN05880570_4103 [Paenibacillus sp. RU4T]|nr:hypothetical protein SAMN05880555_4101 [Paenibacillus sp. RU4X]SIR60934.1 hypothetical protein SAMN05880570_4103 [Paenibacillus sp. RU4T]
MNGSKPFYWLLAAAAAFFIILLLTGIYGMNASANMFSGR